MNDSASLAKARASSTVRVWYSSRRGFRMGVLGLPDDVGMLAFNAPIWRFSGKRINFEISRPANVRLVIEQPGWAAATGAAAMVVGLALIGVSAWTLLLALSLTLLLFVGHGAMSRWVLIEQPERDGSMTRAYLTPAGFGRYTDAPRRLCERLASDIPSPVVPM